jgi:Ni/Fe-hydrogenase subunit HybB-like protein
MRSAMHKEWPAWYSALVVVSALIALIEIVWFLLRDDDRMILLAAFIVAAAVFWATWAPGTGSCC